MDDELEQDDPGRWAQLRRLFGRHRKRLAKVALVVFLAAVALEIGGAYPREVTVSIPLGAEHARVSEAQIEFLQEGEPVHTVLRRFRDGAPRDVRDTVQLAPGDYDVAVLLVERGGSVRRRVGRLTAPSAGVVRIAREGS